MSPAPPEDYRFWTLPIAMAGSQTSSHESLRFSNCLPRYGPAWRNSDLCVQSLMEREGSCGGSSTAGICWYLFFRRRPPWCIIERSQFPCGISTESESFDDLVMAVYTMKESCTRVYSLSIMVFPPCRPQMRLRYHQIILSRMHDSKCLLYSCPTRISPT